MIYRHRNLNTIDDLFEKTDNHTLNKVKELEYDVESDNDEDSYDSDMY